MTRTIYYVQTRYQMDEYTYSSFQQEMSLEKIFFLVDWQVRVKVKALRTTYPKKSLSRRKLTLSRVNWTLKLFSHAFYLIILKELTLKSSKWLKITIGLSHINLTSLQYLIDPSLMNLS